MKRFITGLMFCLLVVTGLSFGSSSSPPTQSDDLLEIFYHQKDQDATVTGEGFIIVKNDDVFRPCDISDPATPLDGESNSNFILSEKNKSASPVCLHIDPGLDSKAFYTHSISKGYSPNARYERILNSKAYLCNVNPNY